MDNFIIVHIKTMDLNQKCYFIENNVKQVAEVAIDKLPDTLLALGEQYETLNFKLVGQKDYCDKIEKDMLVLNAKKYGNKELNIEKLRS